MPKSRKVLFDSKWLRIVELDGWFHASEPSRSQHNMAVAVLPYRKKKSGIEFLARFELNPAHMTDSKHQASIITGACETGVPLYHARQELIEEAGYDIPAERFQPQGIVSPLKASATKLHLYSVRIIGKDKRQEYHGDGGEHESREFAQWVHRETMIWAKDPYIQTIMMRAGL